jgi:GT2 family glycosyltransferase
VAALRNRGARAALGSSLAFADADHEIDRAWIEHAVEVLSGADVAATGAATLTPPSANWVQRQYDGLRSRPSEREDVSWLGSGNLAIKRAVFEKIGGFDASLTACEDVDLCNRVRMAGGRIVADPRLRSIHFGDPTTLRALFYGELWRGRDNLRVTFRGPRNFRHFRSALIPVGAIYCLKGAVVSLLFGAVPLAVLFILGALAPSGVRAAGIVRRGLRPGVVTALQAFAVAVVYDLARALALLARGSHRARRTA